MTDFNFINMSFEVDQENSQNDYDKISLEKSNKAHLGSTSKKFFR